MKTIATYTAVVLLALIAAFLMLALIFNVMDKEQRHIATDYERDLLAYHGRNSTIYEQGGIYFLVRGGKTIKLKSEKVGDKP